MQLLILLLTMCAASALQFRFEVLAPNQRRNVEKEYRIGDLLGAGAFAKVFVGTHKLRNQKVAIKRVDKHKFALINTARADILETEVQILTKCHHRNIVQLVDVFDSKRYLYIVLEHVNGGELFDKIVAKGRFDEVKARQLFDQIVTGVAYLHSCGIVHRDLKPENVLLHQTVDGRGQRRYLVKISDFGMSRVIAPGSLMTTLAGTPQYVAPEVLTNSGEGGGYDRAVDIWSLGVILFVLLTGRQPFGDNIAGPGISCFDQVKAGFVHFSPSDWSDISTEAMDLVKRMLVLSPKARITVAGIKKHKWMKPQAGATSTEEDASAGIDLGDPAAEEPSAAGGGAMPGGAASGGSTSCTADDTTAAVSESPHCAGVTEPAPVRRSPRKRKQP